MLMGLFEPYTGYQTIYCGCMISRNLLFRNQQNSPLLNKYNRKTDKPYSSRHAPYSLPKRRRPLPLDASADDVDTSSNSAAAPKSVVVIVPVECSMLDLKSRFEIYKPISRTRMEPDGVADVNVRSNEAAQSAVDAARDSSFPAILRPTKRKTICLTCGGTGFDVAFVFCIRCARFAVHRYCLDEIPKTVDEFVPWVCDNCKDKVKSQFSADTCEYNLPKVEEKQVNGQPFGSDTDPGSLDHPVIPIDDSKDIDAAAAGPVIIPIWRGSFSILNKDYDNLDAIIAHTSSKACRQVYEVASQFVPMLQFEMLPKAEIWPKSFQKSKPSDKSIALYFFPSKISERDFDILVEKMMNEELGLKAEVQNAELLIFNSTELPLRYWRFQGKYYIWGVFRGKQKPPSQVAKIPLTLACGSPPSCGSRA